MGRYHLPHWLQAIFAGSGGLGLFLLAFLDSTFLPFPSVNDLLLIDLSIQYPARMPYFAAMSTIGSLVGCLVLYVIARKGEEAAFHERAGPRGKRIRRWIERNGFVSMLVAALMPPPMPFKLFVLAAGALGMPLRAFVIAIVIARSVRFYGEGYLAIRYGQQATHFLLDHKIAFTLVSVLSVVALYFAVRLLFRPSPEQEM